MKNIKLITYILSVLMLVSAVSFCVSAADDYTLDYDYTSSDTNSGGLVFKSAEEKLATMGIVNPKTGEREPHFKNDKYEIWANEKTGEVGIRDIETNQIILTNPYDVSTSNATQAVKEQLLSQIIISYKDSSNAVVQFNSYKDAANNGKIIKGQNVGQIKVKRTRKGIRVEYTLGKEQAKYLVPKQIEKSSFETHLIAEWENKDSRDYKQFVAYYDLKDPFDPNVAQAVKDSMKLQFPATEKYAIYVLDPGISNRELEMLSGYIENNTDYTPEQMAEDYELIDYVDTSAAPALFRFAIEYTLDEDGILISVPANSVTYDSANYELTSVKILPYLNAGNNNNTGFTLLADGSGTITRFEDIKGKPFTLTNKIYGKDFSFHTVSGYNQEIMRIPVFGVVENIEVESEAAEGEEAETKLVGSGFVAYFVDGDSLLELSSDHGGTVHNYSSVYATFYPESSDTYSLTGISTTGDAQWSVKSDRKYVGDYAMRVFPIYGEDVDYVDMAETIRNYLVKTGVLEKLDSEENSEDVSLYIENFGTIKTDERIIGFPVQMQTTLTTFDQTKGMIDDLNAHGITNINIKLTGWYNGGMEHRAPSTIDVPGELGGMKGLKNLASYAAEKNVRLYPDLDYTYVGEFGWFDGINEGEDLVQTIDGRDAVHRVYNALYQGFESDKKNIISAGAMRGLYDNTKDKFEGIGAYGVSVATLGSDLNSNHDEDYILNRDEAQERIEDFLAYLKERNGSVMVSGGNAYCLKYVDHILNVPLDSSMNINTSESIPFMGMILHGYTEFAGTPINLDGDYDYSVLKAIENGANLYYVVSKENTSDLKAFPEFSKYYAISYDNWMNLEDKENVNIVDTYNEFNNAMKDVKYSVITDHEKIGTRLVRVEYENGVEFILNYNAHEVDIPEGYVADSEGKMIPEMSFIKIKEGVLVNE